MQSLDTSAHVNVRDPASTSATNTVRVNTDDTVQPQQPQRRPTKLLPAVVHGDRLAWLDWFSLFPAFIEFAAIFHAEMIIHSQTLLCRFIAVFDCYPAMYQYALPILKLRYGQPDCIVMSFLQRLKTFRQPSTDDPHSNTNYAYFISSFMDTFT